VVILNTPTAGTITGFGSGSGASIAQVLTNTEQRQEHSLYSYSTANSCPGSAFTVDVTVNPNQPILLRKLFVVDRQQMWL
jgi:hypothetical protein